MKTAPWPPARREFPAAFEPHWREGLTLLAKAFRLARQAGVPPWDFAVERDHLLDAGLSVVELRYFVSRGWVEHADECTPARSQHRKFRPPPAKYALGEKTCFVLTEAGAAVVETLPGTAGQDGPATARPAAGNGAGPEDQSGPQWDRAARALTFMGQVIKRFKGRARDQMALLDRLQRLGWPQYVEDALTALEGTNRKKRLHHALGRLNKGPIGRRLRFHGYAEGRGLWWEAVGPKTIGCGGGPQTALVTGPVRGQQVG